MTTTNRLEKELELCELTINIFNAQRRKESDEKPGFKVSISIPQGDSPQDTATFLDVGKNSEGLTPEAICDLDINYTLSVAKDNEKGMIQQIISSANKQGIFDARVFPSLYGMKEENCPNGKILDVGFGEVTRKDEEEFIRVAIGKMMDDIRQYGQDFPLEKNFDKYVVGKSGDRSKVSETYKIITRCTYDEFLKFSKPNFLKLIHEEGYSWHKGTNTVWERNTYIPLSK